MILHGCVFLRTRMMSTGQFPTARCLQMNPGQRIVFRFSRVGWTRVAPHRLVATHEDYSLAIIARRSAMCCLMRAIFSGQETRPWYGTPAAYSRSASASASSACSSFCSSVGPGISEGYHSGGRERPSLYTPSVREPITRGYLLSNQAGPPPSTCRWFRRDAARGLRLVLPCLIGRRSAGSSSLCRRGLFHPTPRRASVRSLLICLREL